MVIQAGILGVPMKIDAAVFVRVIELLPAAGVGSSDSADSGVGSGRGRDGVGGFLAATLGAFDWAGGFAASLVEESSGFSGS